MQKRSVISLIVLVAVLVIINLIAAQIHRRFDLTEDNRYSLTTASKDILQNLDEEVLVTVFLKDNLPAEFKKLASANTDFLSVLRENSNAKLKYNFVSPLQDVTPGRTWADSLQAGGAAPINLTVQIKSGESKTDVYPYAIVQHKNNTQLVNLFASSKRNISVAELNNAEALLEYQFLKAIDQLKNPNKPFVAYSVGNGQPTDAKTYDLQQTISSNYKLFVFDLTKEPVIPDTIKTLVIVKPTESFTDAQKLKIDQYVMRGGKVLWFLDNLNAEQDSLSYTAQLIAYDRALNVQDLLFHYGVRINPDLVMDLQCDFMPFAVGGTAENPQFEFLHWNYYPLFEPRGNHIINKNLGLIAGRFVNSIDTISAPNISKTFLLQSSANSRTISTPALISPNENRNAPQDDLFRQNGVPTAVLLEGNFTSLYRSRLSTAQRDSLQRYGGFVEKTGGKNKMIVVADGDMVLNDVSPKDGPLPMGTNFYTVGSQYEYRFANKDFLLNCLEYLTSNERIIETRNKEIVLRLLDVQKVENEKTKWQAITIALPIILIIIAGVLFQYLRKRKYAR